MTFSFSPVLPPNIIGIPEVISGENSFQFAGSEYLLVYEEDGTKAFEIRYQFGGGNYSKEAVIINNLLLVGHECHFYVYDLQTKQNILTLEMDGYFGNLYFHQDYFYVSDLGSITCLNKKGAILWRNNNLGIDGVLIHEFTENEIQGSGEWDPPGGWRDFVLDLKTGKLIKENDN